MITLRVMLDQISGHQILEARIVFRENTAGALGDEGACTRMYQDNSLCPAFCCRSTRFVGEMTVTNPGGWYVT